MWIEHIKAVLRLPLPGYPPPQNGQTRKKPLLCAQFGQ